MPGVPWQAFIARDDFIEVLALALAILVFLGAAAAAWIVVVRGGSLVWAGLAAVIGAAAAGGVGALMHGHMPASMPESWRPNRPRATLFCVFACDRPRKRRRRRIS